MYKINKVVQSELDREIEMLELSMRRISSIIASKDKFYLLDNRDLGNLKVSLNDAQLSCGKIQSLRGVLHYEV